MFLGYIDDSFDITPGARFGKSDMDKRQYPIYPNQPHLLTMDSTITNNNNPNDNRTNSGASSANKIDIRRTTPSHQA